MTPNAGQRGGLLASARGTKEPKRPPKYRRGGVANTGASLQPPRPDVNAGRQASEGAKFLGQMQEMIFGKGMLHEQYREAEKEKGIAQFEKANSEQREGFRDAINNGWIDSKESPYFREGVTVSHTKNLLTKTSLDLYTEYEKWEGKNDPSSGAFDKWLETQDEKIAINLENIPDNILANNFYEPHQAIKRQLAQQHAGHLNKEYRDKANVQADLRFNGLMKQHSQAMGLDLGSDPNMTISEILRKQGISEDQARRVGHIFNTVPRTGDKIGVMPPESLRQLELMATNESGVAEQALFNYNGTEAEELRIANEYEVAWENTPQGQDIMSQSAIVTTDPPLPVEFIRNYSEKDMGQKQKDAEDFNRVISMTAKPPVYLEEEPVNTFTNINDQVHGSRKNITFNSGKNLRKQTPLTKNLVKVLKPEVQAIAETMKIVTETAVKNIDLGAKGKDGKYVAAGGNSETMVSMIIEGGSQGGAHADWFKQLNVGQDGGIPKETLLAISHAFFDVHHEGLLTKKPKKGFESKMTTRRVTGDFKKTKINETSFVSFVEGHKLFEPYKKATGS